MPGESVCTINSLLPKGQHPLQNRSIFLPLPRCDLHWGRALSCPSGTGRAQPSSDSPCPAELRASGAERALPSDPIQSRARRQPHARLLPQVSGCRLCLRAGGHREGTEAQCRGHGGPRRPPGTRFAGKGKPRHITETRAPHPPALRLGRRRRRAPRERRGRGLRPSALPRGGRPPKPKGKALLPWPLFLERVPAAQGRDKGGGAAAPRPPRGGEGQPPPAPLRRPAHMHSRTATTTSGITLFIPFPMA